jgi:hypothetical protein
MNIIDTIESVTDSSSTDTESSTAKIKQIAIHALACYSRVSSGNTVGGIIDATEALAELVQLINTTLTTKGKLDEINKTISTMSNYDLDIDLERLRNN